MQVKVLMLLFESHGWNPGPMEVCGNTAMKDFTPHVGLEIYTFLKQTFLEGKAILNFLKGLQQCFNLSQALLLLHIFSVLKRAWERLPGTDV